MVKCNKRLPSNGWYEFHWFADWRGFLSEGDIEQFVASLSLNEITGGDESIRAAIVFQSGFRPEGDVFRYKIRMMDNSLAFPAEAMALYPSLQLPGPNQGRTIHCRNSIIFHATKKFKGIN